MDLLSIVLIAFLLSAGSFFLGGMVFFYAGHKQGVQDTLNNTLSIGEEE